MESSLEKEGIVWATVVLPLGMFVGIECLSSHWKYKIEAERGMLILSCFAGGWNVDGPRL